MYSIGIALECEVVTRFRVVAIANCYTSPVECDFYVWVPCVVGATGSLSGISRYYYPGAICPTDMMDLC